MGRPYSDSPTSIIRKALTSAVPNGYQRVKPSCGRIDLHHVKPFQLTAYVQARSSYVQFTITQAISNDARHAVSRSVHAKGIIRSRGRRGVRRRFPFDGNFVVIFALPTVLAPELELNVGCPNEYLDVEFGSVVFWGKIVPVPVLPFHICRI
jgi:hypothetical protein